MSSLLNLLLLIIEIWFLAGVIITLHRYSTKIGLTPITVFMGGLTAALQFQSIGWVTIEAGWLSFSLDTHSLLPVLLFGLLILYMINGTLQARGILLGMLLVTIFAITVQIVLPIHIHLPGGVSQLNTSPGYSSRLLISSFVAFAFDLIMLILVYQTASNIRNRYPSQLASILALFSALWSDAIIFPILAFWGEPTLGEDLLTHLAGKSLAGLALCPLVVYYLHKVAPKFPESAGSQPRSAWDFFTTSAQLEAQARYHYGMHRIRSEFNKLLIVSTEPQTMLEKACELIAASRGYPVVWIAIGNGEEIHRLVKAGPKSYDPKQCLADKNSPSREAFTKQKSIVIDPIKIRNPTENSWQKQAIEAGFRSMAVFPLRYSDQYYGILNVYEKKPNTFTRAEINVLQDLADDLAYALVSIEAREQQAILTTAAETMRDGLLLADLEGNIVYVNSIVTQITGISTEELSGQNFVNLLTEEQARGFDSTLQALLEKGRLSFELDYYTPNRQTLVISINAALVHNKRGHPQHIVANMRDITKQRRYENQLLTINRLTTDLVQVRDIPSLLENILPISEELLNANASLIYTINPESNQVLNFVAHHLPGESSQYIAKDDRKLPGHIALETYKPVYVTDTRNDPTFGDCLRFVADEKIHSLVFLPIGLEDVSIGVLIVGYTHSQFFDENHARLGMTLAQTLAIIIQNARLYEYSRQRADEMAAMVTASASLATTLDYKTVLQVITEQLAQTFDIQSCAISDYDPEANTLQLLVEFVPDTLGVGEEWYQPYQLKDYPRTKEVLDTNTPCQFRIDDPDIDQAEREFMINAEINYLLMVPLVTQDQTIGLIELMDTRKEKSVSEDQIVIIQTLSSQAAVAIQNTRLYEAERTHHQFAEALIQAAASLNSTLDLEGVFDKILEQLMQVVPCKAANFMMIVDGHGVVHRHRGYDNMIEHLEAVKSLRIPISTHNISTMLHGEPVLIANTHNEPRWEIFPGMGWIKSYVGIPLKIDQEVSGFLNADSDIPGFFTKEMVYHLQTFANHAATAMKNARLYTRSKRRAEEMAALVIAAATVSTSLETQEVFNIVAQQMTLILDIQNCTISDFDPAANTLTQLAAYTPDEREISAGWSKAYDISHYPLTRKALETHTAVQSRINDHDLDETQRQFMTRLGIKTHLMIPLLVQDRAIGLIELMDDKIERTFTDYEIELGQTLASHAAIAIQNADLYQQLQDHATALETSVQIRTAELRAAKEHIEGILASVPDAVFVLDKNKNLIHKNYAGTLLLDEAEKSNQDLFSPEFLNAIKEINIPEIHSLLEVGGFAYQARASEIILDDAQQAGQIIVFRDVTRFKELDQLKTQFVSDVSHELRTPLTNLTLYLGFLESDQSFGNRQTYLDILKRETERLTNLIEDLLAFSRIQLGKIGGKIQPVEVNQIVHQLTVDRAFLAGKKEIQLAYTSLGDLPHAMADPNWLIQTLSNLLTNAINYTPAGGRVLLQTEVKARKKQNWVVIHVIDNGVGITEEEIPFIFDRFYRGSASQKTGADGTGLGLAISKELVARMGGEISFESSPGTGSTFTIWLRPAISAML